MKTATRFTVKTLDSKLDAINKSLGLSEGDVGSLERSTQGGIGSCIEIITCDSRSVTRITSRTTPRNTWEEFMSVKAATIEKMRATRKTYKSYSNHVRDKVKSHIMACTDTDSMDEAFGVVMEQYNAWDCDYYKRIYPNHQQRFMEFMNASCFFEVYHYDQNAFLDTLSLKQPRKKPSNQDIQNFYQSLVYMTLFKGR